MAVCLVAPVILDRGCHIGMWMTPQEVGIENWVVARGGLLIGMDSRFRVLKTPQAESRGHRI